MNFFGSVIKQPKQSEGEVSDKEDPFSLTVAIDASDDRSSVLISKPLKSTAAQSLSQIEKTIVFEKPGFASVKFWL